jgi:hypothetical protein
MPQAPASSGARKALGAGKPPGAGKPQGGGAVRKPRRAELLVNAGLSQR